MYDTELLISKVIAVPGYDSQFYLCLSHRTVFRHTVPIVVCRWLIQAWEDWAVPH